MTGINIEVKETILKAAQQIFARYGFKKTTIDEIAKASHKAKSSIYHYFKSKEEIFQAIIEKESLFLNKEIYEAMNRVNTPQEKINEYIITRMETLQRVVNYYGALKDEYLEHYAFIEKIRKTQDEIEITIIRKILKDGIDQGVFNIKDIKVTAFTLFTALKGLEYSWFTGKDRDEIKRYVADLLHVLFYGIVAR